MRIYVAGPFFNPAQVALMQDVECLIEQHGHEMYRPRLDSPSRDFTPEQRKDYNAWKPVIQQNIDELHRCDLLLAVVEWALPVGQQCGVLSKSLDDFITPDPALYERQAGISNGGRTMHRFTPIEVPDSGTVWEMGYLNGFNAVREVYSNIEFPPPTPIVAFHSQKVPSQMNLMLSHTSKILCGFDNLGAFLSPTTDGPFNWAACARFDGETF